MLVGLRHPPLVSGDDEQGDGKVPSGQRGGEEPLMTGHVDERDVTRIRVLSSRTRDRSTARVPSPRPSGRGHAQ